MLLILLIPGFAAWFFPYAERDLDQEVRRQIESSVQRDAGMSAEEKTKTLDFYRMAPVSRIMASSDPEIAELQAMFKSTAFLYANFRWMKYLAWFCLGTVGVTLVIVGLSVAFSLRSHAAQYYALRVGWPVLRTASAILVIGQAVLAVALSYWVTAVLLNLYIPKIIIIIAVLAVLAVWALIRAIFAKVDDRMVVNGEPLSEDDAPDLWRRVREMAEKLQTAAPDRIVVGVDPSFFVTEHPVIIGGERKVGRTLYLSLPMLKVLGVEEADAVLGHELAHFSGNDTLWSRKIGPLLGKFEIYLHALSHGLSILVALFMLFFWNLYRLSLHKLSRAREFRADRIGSELVSAEAMKRALIKVAGYCKYRAETESAILEKQRVDPSLDLAGRMEQGYPTYLSAFVSGGMAQEERVPHPFDTHPTLHNRLAELGFDVQESLSDTAIQAAVPRSWYQAITTAPALEARFWNQQQEELQAFHREQIAWRLLPSGPEEIAAVQEHFPHMVFRKKNGKEATLDYDRIHMAEWPAPILFSEIRSAVLEEAFPKKRLTIVHAVAGKKKDSSTKFYPGLFKSERGDLEAQFGRYYSRYRAALDANSDALLESAAS